MTVNKLSLIQDMNKVLPGIATGSAVLENADTIVFNNGHIYSYNSAISVDVCETNPSGLKGIVKGIDFYKCLTKLPGNEIEVEIEKDCWKIKDGNIHVKMNILNDNAVFERLKSLQSSESWMKIDSSDFHEALAACNMPRNNSKYAGIFFNGDYVLSTDIYTINKYLPKDKYPKFWIGNNAVTELLKWNNFDGIRFNKMWIQFHSADDAIFSVRTLDMTTFPIDMINNVIVDGSKLEPVFSSEFGNDFFEAINRAQIFSMEDDGHDIVIFDIGKDGSKISSERKYGSYEESVISIKSDNPMVLKLDIQAIRECASKYTKFKVIKRTDMEAINLILETENSLKMISTIC